MRTSISRRTKATFAAAGAVLLVAIVASAQNLDVKGTLTAEGLGGSYHRFSSTDWKSLVVGGGGGTNIVVAGNLAGTATLGALDSSLTSWQPLFLGSGSVGIGTTLPRYPLDVVGSIRATGSLLTDSWLMTNGGTGWYNSTYQGGWWMNDSTWIRSYNDKSVWTGNGVLGSQAGFSAGYGGVTPPAGRAVIAGSVGIGTTTPGYKLDVRGAIAAGNSDLYFTNTAHDHSGLGNTNGYAAIENAANYGTLMIMGRSGTSVGRRVDVWDYLQVNGSQSITGNLNVGGSESVTGNLNVSGRITAGAGTSIYLSACDGTLTTRTTCTNNILPINNSYLGKLF